MYLSLLGLQEQDVAECVVWMRSFAHVLQQQNPVELKKFPVISADNAHNIQTHTVSLELLVCLRYVTSLSLVTRQCYLWARDLQLQDFAFFEEECLKSMFKSSMSVIFMNIKWYRVRVGSS